MPECISYRFWIREVVVAGTTPSVSIADLIGVFDPLKRRQRFFFLSLHPPREIPRTERGEYENGEREARSEL